jgi:hypothetical protein
MTTGLPPQPTCRHIAGGFLLFVLLCSAFFALPSLVKWGGSVFTFIPAQLGLIDVVKPAEVRPVHMGDNPTALTFDRPGRFALFTQNVDLLVINDAVVAAHSKPWIRLVASDRREVPITLVERGMAFFDTPFAKGRPVARFEIKTPGTYDMFHPTRDDFTYIVPDYTFGREGPIVFWMLLQGVLVAVGLWYWMRKRKPPLRRIAVPQPTGESRRRFLEESVQNDDAPAQSRSLPAGRWAPGPAAAAAYVAPEPDARDILALLHDGQLTPQQAEAEFDGLLQDSSGPSTGWSAKLGFSAPEAAAFSQGASMADLVKFRYEGWPNTCTTCGHSLDHADLTWWFARDASGAPALRHIQCPPKPSS